ncbi:nuclear transport factor 2-like [Impatiens glandulifera]|uniref:nuclear transport factor 2-like n=1 Tax=Impatiens glandulifera TaxID=253017 RepID=UPI001FB06304|nr:nuclear transport factor 2-like [Impatiens glandulifera]
MSSVSATQVGPYFVGQFYQILQQQPDFAHQFYNDSSTIIRIDGDSTETAADMLQIHNLIMSLNYTGIEIRTINALESWEREILVVVSGFVKGKHFNGKRNFVETFCLAPQEKGYFVLNDVFHFVNEEGLHHHPGPNILERKTGQKIFPSTSVPEPTEEPDYGLEEQAAEYMNSLNIEGEVPIEHYSFQDHQEEEEHQEVFESEPAFEEAYLEESPAYPQDVSVQIPSEPFTSVSEPVGEPAKLSYASILRVAKGPSVTAVAATKPSFSNGPAAPEPEWELTPQPAAAPRLDFLEPTAEASEDVLPLEDEGELKSVYVRNLPSTIAAADIEQEFRHFGKIKQDGVFIRNRNDIGVCYAFVEFEDLQAVHSAIQASPILLGGRPVYVEGRRASSIGSARGGGRRGGRGRGGYQAEMPQRGGGGRYGGRTSNRGGGGGYQDSGDFSRSRNSNGFRGS